MPLYNNKHKQICAQLIYLKYEIKYIKYLRKCYISLNGFIYNLEKYIIHFIFQIREIDSNKIKKKVIL
jgi:hypothetical protein